VSAADVEQDDALLLENLAIEVIKYAVSKLLHDTEPEDLINDAPDYLGLDELSDEDWTVVHDLVDAATTTVEVDWHG
jgi:hypothetical protein